MKLYLDTANIEEIKTFNKMFNIDGVTTNPTIITKEINKDLNKILDPISKELNPEQKLFVEVVAHDTKGIVKEAKYIASLRKENCIPKIPVTPQGLQAIKILSAQGIEVLATAILTSTQGYMAAKNGARYLAPYYNRMSIYGEGYEEVTLMQQAILDGEFDCEIVGAGFKNNRQIKEMISIGVDSITVAPDICRQMFEHDGTESAVETFEENWKKKFNRKTLV